MKIATLQILSWRLLRRDWRAGELRVLLAAVLIAVACVTSVAFFTDRIAQALEQQSGELLGADLRLLAHHPLPIAFARRASELGLLTTRTRSFRSMVVAGERTKLVEIKAVEPAYPLRGQLRIASSSLAADMPTRRLPVRGEVWAGPRLLQQLELGVGDSLQLGEARLRIGAVLRFEPDRSGELFSIAPRLLINLHDLPATGLEQEGSRIQYALLVAGDRDALQPFRDEVTSDLGPGERLENAANARREVRTALVRARQFLGLAAVVAVVLACVAIAMAARRYAQRHLDTCAMLRCLGASQASINGLFLLQLLLLGLLAGLLGVALGWLAQWGLAALLSELLHISLPSPSAAPMLIGLGIAFGGLLGFALPPVLRLREVPTLRVLRRAAGQSVGRTGVVTYLAGVVALAVLVLLQAGEVRLGAWLLLGVAVTTLVLWLAATLLLQGVRWMLDRLDGDGNPAWRFGLSNLIRRQAMSTAQVMAFGVGIMVLLLLTVVRGDLLRGWAASLPADAPNRFVINIQPDQLAAVQTFFRVQGGMPTLRFYPMVRGRLQAINDTPVSQHQYDSSHAQGLMEREFNLSWVERLPQDNAVVAGDWWAEGAGAQFSVAEGIARTLGIRLGDRLTYRIAGEEVSAEVTSLRSVQWDNLRANFFVLAPPGTLDAYPASYITSFYLPAGKAALLDVLVQRFPNLTVVDIAAIMDQVRLIIQRVSLAVEYVFGFTLAAGLAVMYAAIQSTLDERLRENAILRALGARRRRLWQGLITEFVTLGGLAGLLAGLLAGMLGYVIADQVLEVDYMGNSWLWLMGLMTGSLGVGLAGIIGTRQVVNTPPLRVLH